MAMTQSSVVLWTRNKRIWETYKRIGICTSNNSPVEEHLGRVPRQSRKQHVRNEHDPAANHGEGTERDIDIGDTSEIFTGERSVVRRASTVDAVSRALIFYTAVVHVHCSLCAAGGALLKRARPHVGSRDHQTFLITWLSVGGAGVLSLARESRHGMWSVLLFVVLVLSLSNGLHLSGEVVVNSDEIIPSHYRYLTKFAVKSSSNVFMFGNSNPISAENNDEKYDSVQLAFVPQSVWDQFKETVDSNPSNPVCDSSLIVLNSTYISDCSSSSPNFYIRTLPCKTECENQQPGISLPLGSQFSYVLNPTDTEYWYAFLVYCALNYTFDGECLWQNSEPVNFTYNFSIVNSEPFTVAHHPDPFTFQFPYNLHGILISYLVFAFLYTVLVPTHALLHSRLCTRQEHRVHPMVWLFSVALLLEALNVYFGLLNFSVYASNGHGVPWLSYVAEGWNLLGDWFLILVFILIAGGWQVTRKTVKWKYASFPIWGVYVVFSGLYFIVFIVSWSFYLPLPLSLSTPHSLHYIDLFLADIPTGPALGHHHPAAELGRRCVPRLSRTHPSLCLVSAVAHLPARKQRTEASSVQSLPGLLHVLVLVSTTGCLHHCLCQCCHPKIDRHQQQLDSQLLGQFVDGAPLLSKVVK